MRHPSRPGEPLEWEWVIDYYHASEYVHKLSQPLFRDPRRAQSWAGKMCRWLKTKPRAIYRILHSAAAIRSRRLGGGSVEGVPGGVRLPADHIKHLDYVSYRRNHLPIGSGVTEAACKTVFSQRLKRSGMAWSVEGRSADRQPSCDRFERGVVGSASIVLAIEEASRRANSGGIREEMPEKSRIIPGVGAIAPTSTAGAQHGTPEKPGPEGSPKACPHSPKNLRSSDAFPILASQKGDFSMPILRFTVRRLMLAVAALAGVFAVAAVLYQSPEDAGAAEARKDIAAGNLRLKGYGLPAHWFGQYFEPDEEPPRRRD